MLQLAAWVWLAVIWLLYFAGWPRLLGLAFTAFAAWYALRRPLPIGSLTVGSGGEAVLFLQPQQIAVAATLRGGLVLPGSVTGAVMPNAHRAGLAAGLMGFAQMFGATCSGLLLSQLRDGSAAPMIVIQAGFALSALVAFQLLRQRQVKTLSYI